ncbi:MAG: hemerythrin domain-containing protein [Parachlamydia sp.]|nr:hemerythrin domain-containing protein [Parachlamydia sp.]
MRYQFYREHKYVCSALNDVERLIAKTDFSDDAETDKVRMELKTLMEMLEGHAEYEDNRLHTLLKKRGSTVHEHVELDHLHQDEWFASLINLFGMVAEGKNSDERIESGNRFYLAFRKFVSDYLAHLHEEETIILPEIQRLYTDEELRVVEHETYRQMTSEEMAEMMNTLFPHMNRHDKEAFQKDIRDCEPEKFAIAKTLIAS